MVGIWGVWKGKEKEQKKTSKGKGNQKPKKPGALDPQPDTPETVSKRRTPETSTHKPEQARTGQNNKEQQGTTRRNQKQPEATKNTTVRGAEPCWQCFSIHQQTKRQETTLASSSYIELQSNSIELQSKSYPSPIELYKCKECPRARTRASAPARFERIKKRAAYTKNKIRV